MADADKREPAGWLRTFARHRVRTLVDAVGAAPIEELVRGVLALMLVIVLLLLVITPPSGKEGLVASSKTLAIAVIAFYFGLHKATPGRGKREPATDRTR